MTENTSIPRRTIEELATLYSLEPNVRDVVTEGDCDCRIVQWFLSKVVPDAANLGVFSVDQVDVPNSVLASHGLTRGNRSEVIVLCRELEAEFGASFTQLTGIIDRDFESVLAAAPSSTLVLKTDFSCAEVYLLSESNLTKMLKLAFPEIREGATILWEMVIPVAQELFLVRAANQALDFALEWIDFESFVEVHEQRLSFRRGEFCRNYLVRGAREREYARFEACINEVRGRLPGDPRMSVNGHDAMQLLGLILRSRIRRTRDKPKANPRILLGLLMCSLDVSDLIKMSLFSKLLARIQPTGGESTGSESTGSGRSTLAVSPPFLGAGQ